MLRDICIGLNIIFSLFSWKMNDYFHRKRYTGVEHRKGKEEKTKFDKFEAFTREILLLKKWLFMEKAIIVIRNL